MNKRELCLRSCTAALAAAGAFHAPAALAQDAASDEIADNVIIVNAQRRDAPAQDVPIAITALPAERLTASGIVSSYDLPRVASGLTTGQQVAGFQPYLRGVGTAFFGPGIENPVSLYVDDVYYSSQLLAPIDLSNLASVTVLKGPQGTLFGRNSTGGVIQMSTRAPQQAFAGELRTELDNFLTSRSLAYLNGGLSEDLAANISVQYATQGDGWGESLLTGDDVHKIDHDLSARVRLLWTPGADTRVHLNLDYSYRRNSLGPNFTLYRDAPIPAILPTLSGNVYDVDNDPQTDNRLHTGGGSIKLEQDLGPVTAVSITAYREYSFDAFYDTDAVAAPASNSKYTPKGDQFSQELQLVSKDSDAFKWVVGGFYFTSSDDLNGSYLGFNDASEFHPLLNFTFFPGFSSFFLYHPDTELKTKSAALFGEATYNIAEQTRLTLGGRWTWEKRSISGTPELWAAVDRTNEVSDGFSLGTAYDDFTTPEVEGPIDNSFSTSRFTYRAILDHRFSDEVMAYASYNHGFKSGGFNAYYTYPVGDPLGRDEPFKGETLDAYEVGLKSEFMGRTLRLNPSFFYYDYKNLQVLSLIDSAVVTTNAESAELYGLDLDAMWQPTRALTFNAGVLWMRARYKRFDPAPIYSPLPGDGGGVGQPVDGDASGNQLPLAPDLAFNVSADYELLFENESSLNFNVTYSYNDGYPFEPDNNVMLDSFGLLNAAVTWRSANEKLSIGVFARNITDEIVPGSVSATPPLGYVADYSNPPRTYGVTASMKFGD